MTDDTARIAALDVCPQCCSDDDWNLADQTCSLCGFGTKFYHAFAALELQVAALRKALDVPKIWTEVERDGLQAAFAAASQKHGHYETLFAVAAWILRHRQAQVLPAPSPSRVAALVEAAMKLRECDIDKLGEGFHRALLELHDATDALTGKEPGDE